MAERTRRSFPGGPRHSVPGSEGRRPARIQTVEEIEAGIASRTLKRRSGRRRRRAVVGFVVATAAAGALGAYVGHESHQTPQEITAAQEQARMKDLDISWQVNRTLLQLWKMEDVEALRNKGRIR